MIHMFQYKRHSQNRLNISKCDMLDIMSWYVPVRMPERMWNARQNVTPTVRLSARKHEDSSERIRMPICQKNRPIYRDETSGFWKYKRLYMDGLEANHGKTRQRDLHFLLSMRPVPILAKMNIPMQPEFWYSGLCPCTYRQWSPHLQKFDDHTKTNSFKNSEEKKDKQRHFTVHYLL